MEFKLFSFALSINLLSIFLVLCFYPFKLFAQVCARIFRQDLESILPGCHSQYAIESPGKSISNIVLSIVLDGELTAERVRRLFMERIKLEGSSGKGDFAYKRLTQSWAFFWGYAFWKRDRNFRVENHVRSYNYNGGSLALPQGRACDETDLERLLGQLTHQDWDPERSPWELLIIPKYCHRRSDTNSQYQSVLIFRTDHVLMDAYSMLMVLKTLFATDIPTPEPGTRPGSIWGTRVLSTVNSLKEYTKSVMKGLDTSHGFGCSVPMPRAGVTCSIANPIPLDSIKAIKRFYNVSFVAVIHAGIIGAIQRKLSAHGLAPPNHLVSTLVLYKPNRPGDVGNHFSDVIVRWPMNCKSPKERLISIDGTIQEEIRTMGYSGFDIFYQNLLQHLPYPIRNGLVDMSYPGISMDTGIFPTLVADNVRLDGLLCLDAIGADSILPSEGFSVTLTGCRGLLRATFLNDSCLFPSKEGKGQPALGYYFEDEIQALSNGICDGA